MSSNTELCRVNAVNVLEKVNDVFDIPDKISVTELKDLQASDNVIGPVFASVLNGKKTAG